MLQKRSKSSQERDTTLARDEKPPVQKMFKTPEIFWDLRIDRKITIYSILICCFGNKSTTRTHQSIVDSENANKLFSWDFFIDSARTR